MARALSRTTGPLLLGLLAALLAGCALPGTTGAAEPDLPEGLDTTVERVVDGDTLWVTDLDERLRLIGIDTPETPRGGPAECLGPEATAHLTGLVPPGAAVRVVFDVERVDRFGRPLGYLYRHDDGTFVNVAMVRDGYAAVMTVPPNVRHEGALRAAERRAREDDLGLWGACHP